MKRILKMSSLVLILTGIGFAGCVMNKLHETPETVRLRQDLQGQPVVMEIVKGKAWTVPMKAGPLTFNILPQMAIWAEDKEGRLLETLYVTGADYKGFHHAAKNEKGADFYKECLPIWATRVQAAGKSLPSKKEPYPDTVTSATPTAGFALETKLETARAPMSLYLEINQSNDVNATYTEANNDWVGQPSLIYHVEIPSMEPGTLYNMKLIGHGGMLKDGPTINPDVSGFDTALEQVQEIKVQF